MKVQSVSNGRMICLKGNHEEMMLQTMRKPAFAIGILGNLRRSLRRGDAVHSDWWLSKGGGWTLISYGAKVGDRFDLSIVPSSHLDWIDSLPRMHVDEHRVYVHAGVASRFPLDGQPSEVLTRKIYPATDEGGHGVRHVVHGHCFYEDGPHSWKGRTALDTNAWRTGRLVIGVFDDDIPGGPIDRIELKGKPYDELGEAGQFWRGATTEVSAALAVATTSLLTLKCSLFWQQRHKSPFAIALDQSAN
jgi:serine/threonine protein phosphatase 1